MDSSSCCKLSNQISALLYEWLHSLSQYFMWFLFYFFKILLLMFVAVGMTDWLVAWLSFLFFWNICLLSSCVILMNNNFCSVCVIAKLTRYDNDSFVFFLFCLLYSSLFITFFEMKLKTIHHFYFLYYFFVIYFC